VAATALNPSRRESLGKKEKNLAASAAAGRDIFCFVTPRRIRTTAQSSTASSNRGLGDFVDAGTACRRTERGKDDLMLLLLPPVPRSLAYCGVAWIFPALAMVVSFIGWFWACVVNVKLTAAWASVQYGLL
jgi:hypothetical protein